MAGESPRIDLAIGAAELVFDRKPLDPSLEPADKHEARAAVQHLGRLFEQTRGAIRESLDSARAFGGLQSSDRLQGIAEIVQNADDAEASEVRLLLMPTELLVAHDGTPVGLEHVLGLATPWLTTKGQQASSTGRFGIGLSALQSLSETLEVHCAPYHVRIGDPFVEPVEPPDLPGWFAEFGWTTLRVPLEAEQLQSSELEAWLGRWDDSALLFLRHVDSVTLLDQHGDRIGHLTLSRHGGGDLESNSVLGAVSRELVDTNAGRSWAVYSAEVPTPSDVWRAHKATGSTTPVAVALPLETTEVGHVYEGQVYAGLPVIQMRSPLFANAQFDPLTSRTDLADNPWNQALVNLVAEVWAAALLDLFGRDPEIAWQAIPLPRSPVENSQSPVIRALEATVIDKARLAIASQLSFPVTEQGQVSLSQLAVEAHPLEGILQESETAGLAGLSATLPSAVRDPAGRWRDVLDDWRSHGADLPAPITVHQALDLVGDESRPVDSTIALVAAALHEGLREHLLRLACLTTHDERRLVPPTRTAVEVLTTDPVPLAEQLGIATRLHPAHLASTKDARNVLDWLQECGALLDSSDDGEVVRRLAQAGRVGHSINTPLTDEQVRALRDAFERIAREDRDELGPDVGLAVRLASYGHDPDGRRTSDAARPGDAYLPRAIDREPDSFAVAADTTPGLVWLSGHYATALRRGQREGIGALRFLRLLGAETAPRLQPHQELWRRYDSDTRQGLQQDVRGGPEARRAAMKERGATYTLEDSDSPDLLAVVTDISRERRSKQRRKRAGALLATLGRAWDRRLGDLAEVDSATAYYGWELRGKVRAFWLAQAGDVAWLDDESRTARKPTDLRVRAPGTEAIYGPNSPDYLHADLRHIFRPVLTAFGVVSDPSRRQLVERLRELQFAADGDGLLSEDLRHDSALIYRALARTVSHAPADSDLNDGQLHAQFARHRLVLTDLGWLSPRRVLAGPPIFGDLRPFAPAVTECEQLWRVLGLRPPSPEDCLEVLRSVARRRKSAPNQTEEAVLLETLRALNEHHSSGRTVDRKKLARLALWTTKGWTRGRPVYATDDPDLAAGLGDVLPVWQPGAGFDQFHSLIKPLRVTEVRASEAEVVSPEHAREDPAATELFRRALELLRDDLQRNAPELVRDIAVPWACLAKYAVKVHHSLALSVRVAAGQEHQCEVKAKVDVARNTIFVLREEQLPRVDGGGRAVAALFVGNERPVAHAWRAMCDRVEEGTRAQTIELARERAARAAAKLDADRRLVEFRERTAQGERSPRGASDRATGEAQASSTASDWPEQREQHPPATAPRTLVDPESLELVDPEGRMHQRSPSADGATNPGLTRGTILNEPAGSARAPQNRLSARVHRTGQGDRRARAAKEAAQHRRRRDC